MILYFVAFIFSDRLLSSNDLLESKFPKVIWSEVRLASRLKPPSSTYRLAASPHPIHGECFCVPLLCYVGNVMRDIFLSHPPAPIFIAAACPRWWGHCRSSRDGVLSLLGITDEIRHRFKIPLSATNSDSDVPAAEVIPCIRVKSTDRSTPEQHSSDQLPTTATLTSCMVGAIDVGE